MRAPSVSLATDSAYGSARAEAGPRNPLGDRRGLQRETDGAQRERHTRWRMSGSREAESRRGSRREAGVVEFCQYKRLAGRLLVHLHERADQWKVIDAGMFVARCHAVVRGLTDCVH